MIAKTTKQQNSMICDTDKKLKKIVIVARHGPRVPIKKLDKLDQSYWISIKSNKSNESNESKQLDKHEIATNADLTEKGKEYCKEFGKYLKNKYMEFLNINEKNISFYSSKISRTQETAIIVAKELCGKNLTNADLKFHTSISADKNILFKNDQFDKFRKLTTQIELDEEYNEISNNLKQFVNTHIGRICSNNHFFDIAGSLECYQFEQLKLPEIITNDILENIEKCALSYYKNLFAHNSLQYIGHQINEFVLDLLKNDNNKIIYLSTHDTIIFPLSRILNNNYLKLPKFCSNIIFELFCDNSVDVYYDNILIKKFNL